MSEQTRDPLADYIAASIKNDPHGPIARAVRRMCAVVLDFQREWDALDDMDESREAGA